MITNIELKKEPSLLAVVFAAIIVGFICGASVTFGVLFALDIWGII